LALTLIYLFSVVSVAEQDAYKIVKTL
jgi:hypothetical protein